MRLSILIPGKNDDYRKNTKQVLKFNLEQTIKNLKDDIELVLCDWGSKSKIVDDLNISKHKNFKCVYVSSEITKKYNDGAEYSIVHPINTAFKNSVGKYVIFWDSDCFVPDETFVQLYEFIEKMDNVNDLNFYWGSRYNANYNDYKNIHDIIELQNILPNITKWDSGYKDINFMGCGTSLLMNRSIWEESTGFWENLPHWGWQDIEFHNRLIQNYTFGGDLNKHHMKFYHLMCNEYNSNRKYFPKNPQINSYNFAANGETWGLSNEVLEVI